MNTLWTALAAACVATSALAAELSRDPIGVIALSASKPTKLFVSPQETRPVKTAPLGDAFFSLPTIGYQGEGEHDMDYLVWRKLDRAARPMYMIRDDSGYFWVEDQLGADKRSAFTELKVKFQGASHVVLDAKLWDKKLHEAPGATASRSFGPEGAAPGKALTLAYFETAPLKCQDTGSVTDRKGGEWTQGSCDPGKSIELFESPGGAPIQMSGRLGKPSPFTVRESSIDVPLIGYPKEFGAVSPKRVFIFEQKDGWAKAKMHKYPPYNGRWAWLRTAEGTMGKFTSKKELFDAVSPWQNAKEALEAELDIPLEDKVAKAPEEYSVKVLRLEVNGGLLWAQVKVYERDLCTAPEGDATAPGMSGWIRVMDSPTKIRLAETTCD